MSSESPNRQPPPRRRSRPITMALLGAAVLSSCVCCLVPAPADDPPGGAGGEFGPQPGTPDSARTATTNRGGDPANPPATRHHSYMPFWLPLFFGRGGGFSAPRPGPNVRPAPAPSPNVTRGGFGRSGTFGGGG